MEFLDRLERRLERVVRAPFARVFRAEVQPVEIASAVRSAMDDRAAVLGPGRTMVPNVFTVELAGSDYERLSSYDRALTDELAAAAEDHARAQRYTPAGAVDVRLSTDDELETGIFRVRPASRGDRRGAGEHGRSRPAEPGQQQGQPERQGSQQPARPPAPRPSAGPASIRDGHPLRPAHLRGAAGGAAAGGAAAAAQASASHTEQLPAAPPRPTARPRPATGVWLELDGRRYPVTTAVTTIGRDPGVDVVVDDPGVSRRHAEVRMSHDGPHLQLIVRDLVSTNGTFLNGEDVGTEELSDGDRLTVGRTSIVVHVERPR